MQAYISLVRTLIPTLFTLFVSISSYSSYEAIDVKFAILRDSGVLSFNENILFCPEGKILGSHLCVKPVAFTQKVLKEVA